MNKNILLDMLKAYISASDPILEPMTAARMMFYLHRCDDFSIPDDLESALKEFVDWQIFVCREPSWYKAE